MQIMSVQGYGCLEYDSCYEGSHNVRAKSNHMLLYIYIYAVCVCARALFHLRTEEVAQVARSGPASTLQHNSQKAAEHVLCSTD